MRYMYIAYLVIRDPKQSGKHHHGLTVADKCIRKTPGVCFRSKIIE